METIYYGHVPAARDWQPSEGCPRAALRASRGDRNNIPDSFFIMILLLDIIYQAIFVYLFIIYIKDLLKFPLICNIAVIILFSYSACDITIFFFINVCLARDLFRELKADF